MINIQFFGGRGGDGGRGGGGGGSGKVLNEEDSQIWSEDPEIYQRLTDPLRREAALDLLDEQGYTREEAQELLDFANDIRNRAETQTVNKSTLYRGERFNSLSAAQSKYKPGAEVTTTQLTSYATDKSLAKTYATMPGTKVSVVITNTSTRGRSVGLETHHYGDAKGVREIIVPKGMTSKVKSTRFDKATNTLYVAMENSATPRKRR
mgnify:CR=1 FL=1